MVTVRGIIMFDNLSDKLQRVFKNLRGEGKLTAENMEAALREIRVALLEADVHFRVVKQFIESIKQKAMGEEVLSALSPTQQVVKIVRDELIKTLGTHQSKLRMANEPPTRHHDRGIARLGQNHHYRKAGALAFEERAQSHRGFGRRVSSRRPPAVERDRARILSCRFTRARRKKPSPPNWPVRPGAKPPRLVAMSCWWIPPAACTSTIS